MIFFSFGIGIDGAGYSWGVDRTGSLCLPSLVTIVTGRFGAFSPTVIPGLPSVQAVAAGGDFVIWLATNGSLYACGSNTFGALGTGSAPIASSSTPVEVSTTNMAENDPIIKIAAGKYHALAISEAGITYTWGSNDFNQLAQAALRQLPGAQIVRAPSQIADYFQLAGREIQSVALGYTVSYFGSDMALKLVQSQAIAQEVTSITLQGSGFDYANPNNMAVGVKDSGSMMNAVDWAITQVTESAISFAKNGTIAEKFGNIVSNNLVAIVTSSSTEETDYAFIGTLVSAAKVAPGSVSITANAPTLTIYGSNFRSMTGGLPISEILLLPTGFCAIDSSSLTPTSAVCSLSGALSFGPLFAAVIRGQFQSEFVAIANVYNSSCSNFTFSCFFFFCFFFVFSVRF